MRGTRSLVVSLLSTVWQPEVVRGELPNCPYLGPVFPKPTNLSESDPIRQALAAIDTAFKAYETDPASNPNETSWSIQVFSTSQDTPVWEHYHTAPNVNTSYASTMGPERPTTSLCHSRAWRQASRKAHRPIGIIRPVSSASGTNCEG